MHLAGSVYRLSSDSDEKTKRLDKLSFEQLVETANKYRNLLGKKSLVKTLRDGGQSLRTSLESVEKELERRKSESNETPVTSINSFEWTRTFSTGSAVNCADGSSDDSCNTSSFSPSPLSCPHPLPVTRQLLNKCSLSERQTRFRTNQTAARSSTGSQPDSQPGSQRGSHPGSKSGSQSSPQQRYRSTVERWADSALATPGGLPARTCLLGIDESLNLLSRHAQQVEDERINRLSSRLHEMSVSQHQDGIVSGESSDSHSDSEPHVMSTD